LGIDLEASATLAILLLVAAVTAAVTEHRGWPRRQVRIGPVMADLDGGELPPPECSRLRLVQRARGRVVYCWLLMNWRSR
jgi:hypothetical protein